MPMKFRVPRWILVAASALLAAGAAHAGGPPRPRGASDLAFRPFTPYEGLTASSVTCVVPDSSGRLWACTDQGVAVYDGARWRGLALGERGDRPYVRRILFASDGSRWFATRDGVYRYRDGRWRLFGAADGLPSSNSYSIVETRAFGRPTVAVGTLEGVARLDGERFVAVPTPPEFPARAVVLLERTRANGRPALWVASSNAGLARYSAGEWTRFGRADGLPETSIEDLAPGPTGSGVDLYAAGNFGIFERVAGRWRRVPGSPASGFRVHAVDLGGGRSELWVGNRAGTLSRRRADGAWETVQDPSAVGGAPVFALGSASAATGRPVVFVGYFGARLTRVALGGAMRFPDRVAVSTLYEQPTRSGARLWAGSFGGGLLRYEGAGVTPFWAADGLPGTIVTGVVEAAPPGEPRRLWSGGEGGAAWFDGRRWRPDNAGLGPRPELACLFVAHGPDGVETLVACERTGLFVRRAGRWMRWPGTEGTNLVQGVEVSAEGRRECLVVDRNGRLFALRADGLAPLGAVPGTSVGAPSLVRLRGEPWLAMPTTAGGLGLRPLGRPEIPWRVIDTLSHPGFPSNETFDAVSVRGVLYVATARGLAALRSTPVRPDSLVLEEVLGAEDGLPSSALRGVVPSRDSAGLWVGTVLGVARVGLVDTLHRAPPPALRLALLHTDSAGTGHVGPEAPLRAPAVVNLEYALLTQHRESDTRFRVALQDAPPGPWSERASLTLGALEPGRYLVRVWARDWRGREVGPAVASFTIVAPFWQSSGARLLYLLVALAAAAAVARWRLRALGARTAAAERQARLARQAEAQIRGLLEASTLAEAERRRLEGQLRDAQRLESLGTLAGGVAHDFNNLLTVILGNTELALGEPALTPDARESLGAVRAAAERAKAIVRQMLTFSRRDRPEQELVALGSLVTGLEPMLRSSVPRSHAFEVRDRSDGALVYGNRTQLEQVVVNLTANAEYAMRRQGGGRLTLTVARMEPGPDWARRFPRAGGGPHLRLSVEDTGEGMPPEVVARAFEPFFTTKPVGEGTGLGLAVLHGIVVAHGGDVALTSAPGAGTTVDVVLPEAAGRAAVPRDGTPAPAAVAGTHARILLVDDERPVAEVTARQLRRLGHEVTVVDAPAAALRALEVAPSAFDLLLTDQTMPGMTGDELVLAARRVRADLPVILVTGFSHLLTPARLAEVRPSAVLAKPTTPDELGAAIAAALRAHA